MGIRNNKHEECLVPYALGIVLLASRVFGVAPLRFWKSHDSWRVRVSHVMRNYSYLLIFILVSGSFTGLIIDLRLPHERAVRVSTKSDTVVWILEISIVALITIEGIKSKYSSGCPKESNKMKWYGRCANAFCLWSLLIYSFDFYSYIYEAMHHNKAWKVVCIYTCFYIQTLTIILLEIQFVAIAFLVNSAFKSINRALKDLISVIELKNNKGSTDIFIVKSVNSLIDTMTVHDKTHSLGNQTLKSSRRTFRDLAVSYGTICDAVREIDRSNGLVVLLLLVAVLLHLVVTPYYLFIKITFDPDNTEENFVLQSFFFVYHIVRMVFLTEAGYVTEFEVDKTRILVSHIVCRTPPSDLLYDDVDLFYKQIQLNKVAYAPLGMCTLTRSLIASIFGGVTTYLVIIFQFQHIGERS